MRIELKPYQATFLPSQSAFCAMISAVGTGKTLVLLVKAWEYAQNFPDSVLLIVRKEYTDLRDSTLKDFRAYFGVEVDGNKEYKFPNGSVIMFRHGGELDVLKNMNLSWVGIEQAEEFETDEVFVFLNDRLRRKNAPYRQLCVIANANGHNWLWRIFIHLASEIKVLDDKTGQYIRRRKDKVDIGGEFIDVDYLCVEANTFANADNLTKDFLARLVSQKETSPNHYLQYVMNSHEEVDASDLLLSPKDVYDAPKIVLPYQNRTIKRVAALDVARFGNDETVYTIIEQKDIYRWEQIFQETFKKVDTTWQSGYCMEMERKFALDVTIVDDVGVGGGVTDNLTNNGNRIIPFIGNANATASKMADYETCNDEASFMTQDLLRHGWLKLLPDITQAEQLMTIRFKYKKKGNSLIKTILTKEEMRTKFKELKSPDRAKALMMAVWGTDKRPQALEEHSINLPRYAQVDNNTDRDPYGADQGSYEYTNLPRYYSNS